MPVDEARSPWHRDQWCASYEHLDAVACSCVLPRAQTLDETARAIVMALSEGKGPITGGHHAQIVAASPENCVIRWVQVLAHQELMTAFPGIE